MIFLVRHRSFILNHLISALVCLRKRQGGVHAIWLASKKYPLPVPSTCGTLTLHHESRYVSPVTHAAVRARKLCKCVYFSLTVMVITHREH